MSGTAEYRTFDDFQPGNFIGELELTVGPTLKAAWQRIGEPVSHGQLPPGLLVALLMRGYGQIVDRRPPGNVHAGLTMTFIEDGLTDDTLRVTVACANKVLRKGRRWVELDAEEWSGGRCLARARLTLLWAR